MRFNDTSSITYMLFVILEKSKTQERLSVFFFSQVFRFHSWIYSRVDYRTPLSHIHKGGKWPNINLISSNTHASAVARKKRGMANAILFLYKIS